MLQITYFCEDNTSKNPVSPVKDYIDIIISEAEGLEKKGKKKPQRFSQR